MGLQYCTVSKYLLLKITRHFFAPLIFTILVISYGNKEFVFVFKIVLNQPTFVGI